MTESVTATPMSATSFVVRLSPTSPEVDLRQWCESNGPRIRELLLAHGVILFRGFPVAPSDFGAVAAAAAPSAIDYIGGTSARTRVEGNVYLSTTFPPKYTLVQHFEMAYLRRWPLKLVFYCETPSPEGGETPVASARALLARLDPRIVATFTEKQVQYEREMGPDLIRKWQETFETTDRALVEERCRTAGMTYEWLDGDRLRVRNVAQGTARHPTTGELTWFNSAHFLHAELREIPNNGQSCFFGDGSPIDVGMLREVRAAFEDVTVSFPWEKGDVMLIDNMLASHGRKPFSGPRKILAWLAEPFDSDAP
ncbi:MAG TPA: TauD/TfdA family dioxygenase [Labilithrix sp.]|nr:TauD/TfdA family dioxygenase [Labilithrix sp.]